MSFLEFNEGPLWYVAATVFLVGVAWRLVATLAIGKPRDMSAPKPSSGGFAGALKAVVLHSVPHGGNLGRTVYHFISGYMFHLGLFAVIFLAAPHIEFIEQRILGISWPALPRWAFIVVAEIAFAGLILLYVRRFADPVMRQLTTFDDHLASWLTFIVMLTGCMALQESQPMLKAIHMFSVNIWLIYFPFSQLMHAFTFSFSRSYTGATYGRRGFTP